LGIDIRSALLRTNVCTALSTSIRAGVDPGACAGCAVKVGAQGCAYGTIASGERLQLQILRLASSRHGQGNVAGGLSQTLSEGIHAVDRPSAETRDDVALANSRGVSRRVGVDLLDEDLIWILVVEDQAVLIKRVVVHCQRLWLDC
jgi:hypothetical protein